MFSIYLEKLLVEFPKNDFVRLYAAYHFAKKQRLYGKCMRTIHELKGLASWNNDASTSILFQEMKHKIILESQDSTCLFNLAEFIQCISFFAQSKVQILKQTELQEMIYQEMKQSSPLLTKISKLGNKVAKVKLQIEANRKKFFQVAPEYYLEPLLLYAHYYLVLNHSYEAFTQFHAIYSNRHQKYAKIFNLDHFCQENFFKKNTSFLIVSGEKQTPGKVLYCGGNYYETLGRNISGQYCGAAVPTITAMDSRILFNSILGNGEMVVLNKLQKRHFYHQNGWMTPVEYFFNVSPFLSQGLTYPLVFRPVKTFEQCILINREGFIESYTRGIGEQLNLSSQVPIEEKHLERICPELQLANEAFNIIAQPDIKNKAQTPDAVNMKTKGKSFFVKKGPMMSRDQAQDICSSYEDGTQIVHLESGNNRFAYRCCKIFPFPNNVYGAKEIYLERILEKAPKETLGEMTRIMNDNDQNFNTDGTLEERRRGSIRPLHWEDECPETYENEKEHGWINFQTLEGNNCKTTSPDMNFPTLQSPLSSTSRHNLISSRSMKSPPLPQRSKTRAFTVGSSPYPNLESVITENEKAQRFECFSNALSRQESVFSLKSEFVPKSKIKKQKIFEQANLATYLLPKYKFLICVLFFVMGSIFLIQQILNFSIRSGFNDLDANKEIVLVSESRNYYLSFLNVVICFVYGQATNIFQIDDLVPGLNLAFFKVFLHQAIGNLTSTNSQLFGIANSLNDAQRQILFQKDVKIYESDDNYNSFTTFQAVNQMVETALRVESEMMINLTNTIDDLDFIGSNLLHDLSVKGSQITDEFFENLQERKDSFLESLLITFLSITIIPIGGLIVANSFVFAQYKVDMKNMLALTKINKQTVEHTLTNLTHFKVFLQQNTNFEETLKEEQYMQLLKNNIESYKNLKNQAVDNLQSPDLKGFTKPYFWFAWIVFVVLLQVTLSFLIYYSVFTKNLKALGNKAYQLYFLDRTASKIIALRSGTFEMLLLNDTGHVFNEVTSVFVAKQIAELQDVEHELQSIFSSEDSENNDLVQNIMFDDACTYLEDQVTVYPSCKKLANYQNKASWINLISNIRQLYQNYLLKYLASDKSSATLLSLQKDFVRNIMSPTIAVSTAINTLLTNNVNEEFVKLNDGSKAWNNRMPFMYLIVIIISIRMGLWNVIWPLNDMEMKFRQLLLLFPANVVLSNFMLKSYLLRVSRGALDSIRNEI